MKWQILILLCSSVVGSARAQVRATAGPLQSAVTISFNTAVLDTSESQKNMADLEKKFAPRQAHIKALNGEVEDLKKQLSTTSDKLAESERSERMQSIESKEKQLQREMEDYRNDSQSEAQQAFQNVAQKVYVFLQEYAQKQGYKFVLERGAAENPVVWYAAESADITAAVVQAYNAKFGVAAPGKEQKSN